MSEPRSKEWKSNWMTWLESASVSGDNLAGFDAVGWKDSSWILHYMYDIPGVSGNKSHNDVRLAEIEKGEVAPDIFGAINLDEVSEVVGGFIQMTSPEPDWVRCRWSELADRLSVSFDDREFPPGYTWFPYKSWPANVVPATEGSMDLPCFNALIEFLAAHSEGGLLTRCVVYYAQLSDGGDFDDDFLVEVELGNLLSILDVDAGRDTSPNNFWPIDKSWMVYTDHDLSGTKVSGSHELIEALRQSPELECINWP